MSARQRRTRASTLQERPTVGRKQKPVPLIGRRVIQPNKYTVDPIVTKTSSSPSKVIPKHQRAATPVSTPPHLSISPIIRDGPIDPSEALERYASVLNWYEQKEITQYEQIYFVGDPSLKTKPTQAPANNHGYDTTTHNYRVNFSDHIVYRYEVKAIIGKGAFGQVLRCHDYQTNQNVAIKVIVNTPQMHQQGLRECQTVERLNRLDQRGSHIVRQLDYFTFRNHVCVVTELLGQNLYEYLKSTHFKPLVISQLRQIARQIFTACAFCHSRQVVHCDLKPENLLLLPASTSQIVVIDFGSCCQIGEKHFDYIQSRFYRAPEVIMGSSYGPPMDVWSAACIIAELFMGKPLFPAKTERDLLEMHLAVLGPPQPSFFAGAKNKTKYFDAALEFRGGSTNPEWQPGAKSLERVMKCNEPLLVDLLKSCLILSQEDRMTAEGALHHPWFNIRGK